MLRLQYQVRKVQEEGRDTSPVRRVTPSSADDGFAGVITGNVGAATSLVQIRTLSPFTPWLLYCTDTRDLAKSVSAPIAPVRRAPDEFEALHVALESRLSALEAALANPDDCALEGLILDLARTATEEAEAAARRASVDALAEADAQAGTAMTQAQTAEAALASERQAGLTLHRSLGAARSELEAAKLKIATLTNDLEHMRDAFTIERTTLRSELSEAERCFAASDTLRQQAEAARNEDLSRERATIQRLTDSLAQSRSEIDAAKQEVASRAADMEAARERADVATRTQADLAQAVADARARVEALGQERDGLKADLEAARQNAARSATAVQSTEGERAAIEQKWHDAEARFASATRERDALMAEHQSTTAQLDAARQGSTTATAALQALETERATLKTELATLETERATLEQRVRDGEARIQTVAREWDVLSAERDAAQAQRDAIAAERDTAQASLASAEAERDAAMAQLDAARQGSNTATAAIQSLDAHRATLEQNLQNAEARAQAMTSDRDAALAQLDTAVAQRDTAMVERAAAQANADALRKAVDQAQEKERARFSELRQRTERQIQDLEAQLLATPEDTADEGVEIDVSLDDVDEAPAAIELDASEMVARPRAAASISRAAQAPPASVQGPIRGASRHGFTAPIEVKLEGETVLLVDISTAGAQVLSNSALKPNKPVKLLLPSSEAIILCKARIVWSRFEPPTPGKPVRYRAGMVFTQSDTAALQVFITRHTGVKMSAGPAEERKPGKVIPVPFNINGGRTEESTRRSREPIASIDFNFPAQRD